ncbi:hypothetical protein EV360DRAFT_55712, partial [Lentinula raphanica]
LDKGSSFRGLRFRWTSIIGNRIPGAGDVADAGLCWAELSPRVCKAQKADIPV